MGACPGCVEPMCAPAEGANSRPPLNPVAHPWPASGVVGSPLPHSSRHIPSSRHIQSPPWRGGFAGIASSPDNTTTHPSSPETFFDHKLLRAQTPLWPQVVESRTVPDLTVELILLRIRYSVTIDTIPRYLSLLRRIQLKQPHQDCPSR
jgi:hypothetical protein